jgi:hypothetical protein
MTMASQGEKAPRFARRRRGAFRSAHGRWGTRKPKANKGARLLDTKRRDTEVVKGGRPARSSGALKANAKTCSSFAAVHG